jgi:hypothetical protein
LKEDGFVSIKVYDLTGQEIRSLVNEKKQPGKYTIDFDASSLPSGIYIYTIKSQNFFLSRKMLLMK